MNWEEMMQNCEFDEDVFTSSRPMGRRCRQRILKRTLKQAGSSRWRQLMAGRSALAACAACLIFICGVTVAAAAIMDNGFTKYWESGDTSLVPVRELNLSQNMGDYVITVRQLAGDGFSALMFVSVSGDDLEGRAEGIFRNIACEPVGGDHGYGFGYKIVNTDTSGETFDFIIYLDSVNYNIRGKRIQLAFTDILDQDGNIAQKGTVSFEFLLDYETMQKEYILDVEVPFKDNAVLQLEKITVSSIGMNLEFVGTVTEQEGAESWEEFTYEILLNDGTKLTEANRIGGGASYPAVQGDHMELTNKFSKIINPEDITSITVNGVEVFR